MKGWMKKFGVATLLSSSVLCSVSCAENENMLVILGVMTADPPECTYLASGSSAVLLSGSVDVAFGGYYDAVLLVANQLVRTAAKSRLRAEATNIHINNAVVTLLLDGQAAFESYSVPATGFVPVGTGEESGYGAIGVALMPGVPLPSGTHYVIAEVRLQGTTSGGDDIESNRFRFQIAVTDSRAGSGAVVYNASANGRGYCDETVCSQSGATASTCGVMGQDGPVDCCACLGLDFCREAP